MIFHFQTYEELVPNDLNSDLSTSIDLLLISSKYLKAPSGNNNSNQRVCISFFFKTNILLLFPDILTCFIFIVKLDDII